MVFSFSVMVSRNVFWSVPPSVAGGGEGEQKGRREGGGRGESKGSWGGGPGEGGRIIKEGATTNSMAYGLVVYSQSM